MTTLTYRTMVGIARPGIKKLFGFAIVAVVLGTSLTAGATQISTFAGNWGGATPTSLTAFQFNIPSPVSAPGSIMGGAGFFTDSMSFDVTGYSAAVGSMPPGTAANNITASDLVIKLGATTEVVFHMSNTRLFQITDTPIGFGIITASIQLDNALTNPAIAAELAPFGSGGTIGITFNGGLSVSSSGIVTFDASKLVSASYSAFAGGVPEPSSFILLAAGMCIFGKIWLTRRGSSFQRALVVVPQRK